MRFGQEGVYISPPIITKKPKTNADRIRSMTDMELAVWLYWKADGSGKTKDQWLEWLREECKSED